MMQLRVLENVSLYLAWEAEACERKADMLAAQSAELHNRKTMLEQHMLQKWLAFRFKRLQRLRDFGDHSWEQLFDMEVKQAAELASLSPTLGDKHRTFLLQLMDSCCYIEE